MPRIYLIRHGKAAAGFDRHLDPGLDETGHEQARAMAAALGPIGPLPIYVSPLLRTRETARPLEQIWGRAATVDARFAELPSPGLDLAERGEWLRRILPGRWADMAPALLDWRRHLLAALGEITKDSVVVTHFIPINTIVGAATGDDQLIVFRPDNCSCTVIDVADGRIILVERGAEAATRIL
jgi:broad specificity phosphatase PhoE